MKKRGKEKYFLRFFKYNKRNYLIKLNFIYTAIVGSLYFGFFASMYLAGLLLILSSIVMIFGLQNILSIKGITDTSPWLIPAYLIMGILTIYLTDQLLVIVAKLHKYVNKITLKDV